MAKIGNVYVLLNRVMFPKESSELDSKRDLQISDPELIVSIILDVFYSSNIFYFRFFID